MKFPWTVDDEDMQLLLKEWKLAGLDTHQNRRAGELVLVGEAGDWVKGERWLLDNWCGWRWCKVYRKTEGGEWVRVDEVNRGDGPEPKTELTEDSE